MCLISQLACSRKATVMIPLTWRNSTCTTVSNMTHLFSVSNLQYLTGSCISNKSSSGLDAALEPNQSTRHIPFIEELLAANTGKDQYGNDVLTTKDLSSILGKRRAVARATNSEFSLSFFHKVFGSAKYVSLRHSFTSALNVLQQLVNTPHNLWRPCRGPAQHCSSRAYSRRLGVTRSRTLWTDFDTFQQDRAGS